MAVIEINHPLIQHKLTLMRSADTDTKSFRENLNEIAKLMTYEATKDLQLKEVETENKDIQNTISADIIELATNAPEDFSIATLASQAKRISEEKNNLGEDEVIISLR